MGDMRKHYLTNPRKHYLINPTWQCTSKCPECWLNSTIRARGALKESQERPLKDWVQAIERDKPDVIDIAGGEPMLISWVGDLINAVPDVRFGLSTNGMLAGEIERQLCSSRLPNLISVNVSLHPRAGYTNWRRSIISLLDTGYHVISNVVVWGDNVRLVEEQAVWAKEQGVDVVYSPFEDMRDLLETTNTPLYCDAGHNHLVVAPDGRAWPCLTTLRSPWWRETVLGNWLDDSVDLGKVRQPCYLYCLDYYVLAKKHPAGDMWGVNVREGAAAT